MKTNTVLRVQFLFLLIMSVFFVISQEERNLIRELTPSQIKAFVTPRQIRALSSQQISQLRPVQLQALRRDHIEAIRVEQIKALTGTQISSFRPEQIPMISKKQIRAFIPVQFQALTRRQIPFLSEDQIKSFSSPTVLIFSQEQFREFEPDQLKLFNRSQLRAIRPEYLNQMHPRQIQALTPNQTRILHKDQIRALNPFQVTVLDRENMESFGESQLEALNSSQIRQTIGIEDVSNTDFSQLVGLRDPQAGYLTSSQRENLIFNQFNALSLEQFQQLTPEQIRSISLKQLEDLDNDKLRSLTSEQLQALTPEQILVLRSKQIQLLTPENMISSEDAQEMDRTEAESGGLCVDCILNAPLLADSSATLCESLIESPVCKDVPEEKKVSCDRFGKLSPNPPWSPNPPFPSVWGCVKFTVGEMISAIWGLLKFTGSNVIDSEVREETGHQASQVMDSIKLYLNTEYEKAYDEAKFMKSTRAAMAVAGSLGELLYKSIADKMSTDVQEWQCFNRQAKAGKVCEYAILFLGGAAYGVKKLKGGAVKDMDINVKYLKIYSFTGDTILSKISLKDLHSLPNSKIEKLDALFAPNTIAKLSDSQFNSWIKTASLSDEGLHPRLIKSNPKVIERIDSELVRTIDNIDYLDAQHYRYFNMDHINGLTNTQAHAIRTSYKWSILDLSAEFKSRIEIKANAFEQTPFDQLSLRELRSLTDNQVKQLTPEQARVVLNSGVQLKSNSRMKEIRKKSKRKKSKRKKSKRE